MSHAFVDITPELASALETGLVLTSNERLRRDLIRAYDSHQQHRGMRVWPTPQVFSLNGWWLRLYNRAAQERSDLPGLLSRERAYLLIRDLAPEGAEHLATAFLDAWDLVQQWRIPLTDPAFGSTEDARLFAGWARRVRDQLIDRQLWTTSQLADRDELLPFIDPRPISCLYFESPSAAFLSWCERAREAGHSISMLEQQPVALSDASRTAFDNVEQELSAVAQWCRGVLETHVAAGTSDELRIGVVVPDLAQRYPGVVRRFEAEFSPLGRYQQAQPFDVAGGSSLTDQPVWRSAADWLELCYRSLDAAALSRLYQSSFLHLPDAPEQLPEFLSTISLPELARGLGSPALTDIASEVSAGTQPLPRWIAEFRRLLELGGWQVNAAGSLQFQAHQQLSALLDELAASSPGRALSATAALDELNAAMSLRLFAPQRTPAPIQILGYLETTGLSFSHLWVTGMDEETWPSITTGNPMLPGRLRRDHGLPRTTPQQELEFAEQRLRQWRAASAHIVFSHPRQRGDREVAPSPLIVDFPIVEHSQPNPLAHPYFQIRNGLEAVADEYAHPVEPGMLRGGTGVFADQAACPFRSWAIHRLGLAEPRLPHAFPDPFDRGRLFHRVMQNVYQQHLGESAPFIVSDEVIEDALEAALQSHYQRFPSAFIERERQRLAQVVTLWLDLERGRAGFSVAAVETSREVAIGDFRINIRLDRLDRVNDSLVIVDYKTGRTTLPAQEGFLTEPQLPIYALSDPNVQGVFYAQLDESKPRMSGIAASDVDLGPGGVQAPLNDSWHQQLQAWRLALEDLAGEIASGYCAVLPRRKDVCDRCHLSALCRIDERRENG